MANRPCTNADGKILNGLCPDYRVLSIQSHVVSGYVGNRCAVFPLQVLGFDVDFINTVQLSNHTGYSYVKGPSLDERSLEELCKGLHENGLDTRYTHLLTGFVRSKALLQEIVKVARSLKRQNPGLVYVCDPVIGDHGKMYVPEDVWEVYRDEVLPLADIVTPNQFEAELLTGIPINSEQDALAAMSALHSKGPPTVIITSSELGDESHLVGFGSSRQSGSSLKFRWSIPRLPGCFTGTGDLFAALVLAWMTKTNGNLQYACETTVSTIQAVLQRTVEYAGERKNGDTLLLRDLELRLVQSKNDIENPTLSIRCQKI